MRTFRSPSGREWTADIFRAPKPGRFEPGQQAAEAVVLRFRSGDLVLDAPAFPPQWEDLPDTALVDLLRQAQPPSLGFAARDASVGRGNGTPA